MRGEHQQCLVKVKATAAVVPYRLFALCLRLSHVYTWVIYQTALAPSSLDLQIIKTIITQYQTTRHHNSSQPTSTLLLFSQHTPHFALLNHHHHSQWDSLISSTRSTTLLSQTSTPLLLHPHLQHRKRRPTTLRVRRFHVRAWNLLARREYLASWYSTRITLLTNIHSTSSISSPASTPSSPQKSQSSTTRKSRKSSAPPRRKRTHSFDLFHEDEELQAAEPPPMSFCDICLKDCKMHR